MVSLFFFFILTVGLHFIVHWNYIENDELGEISVNWETDWLSSRNRLTPQREAIVDAGTGERITFGQLHDKVCQLAGYLQCHGVKKGDRIALLAPNHPSVFELLFACGKIGAIFVPLNFRLSGSEIDGILQDCSPSLLFFHESMQSLVQELKAAAIPKIMIGTECIPKTGESISQQVSPDDPCLMIYTGGTTGKPKGVVLTHHNVFWNSINTIISWGLRADDVTITYLPLFHTGGLNALSLPILHIGGKVVIDQKFIPAQAVELMEKEKCTIILLVPTMYHLMIQTEEFKHTSFSTVHTFLSGGAPCPHSIYEAFEKKGLTFKEGYGLTEAGPNNFYIDPQDVKQKRGSVGKPMFHSTVKIMTAKGQEAAPDEVGELYLQGHHVFHSYYQQPRETMEVKQDGWLLTGDLAKKDKEGYYYIVGRKKDMIITGGENVYPQEIEWLLDQHPDVDEAVVVGLPDETWGEAVTAAIVLKQDACLSEEDVKRYLSDRLAKYKIPKKVYLLSELMKTPIGKIDRKGMISHLRRLP